MDLRRVHWQLTDTPQPAVAAAHWHSTAAESPVGTVADVGQHVQVWWQEEGSWFDATIFAITKGGSRCGVWLGTSVEVLLLSSLLACQLPCMRCCPHCGTLPLVLLPAQSAAAADDS